MPDTSQESQGAAAPPRPVLARSNTFQQRLQELHSTTMARVEPLLESAGSALEDLGDELGVLFDPEAINEMLAHEPGKLPASAKSQAALAAQEAVKEQAEEAQLHRMTKSLLDPSKILLKDKMAFVIGVTNVCLTAFWIGRWPHTYHWYWLFKDLVLFTLRYFIYVKQGMHYMMFEYCYFANLLSLYHLFLAPQSALLRKFSFAVMSGPLMWSIVAMRNSLVFHDGDKITTLMMHASPALSAWCMRWYPQPRWTAGMSADQLAAYNSASWFDMAIVPAALNLVWVVSYYLIIFVLVNKRIQARGYQNMFTAMVERPSARKSALAKLVLSAPKPLQPMVYLGLHTFAAWLSLVPTKLWFDSFTLHTMVLAGVLLWSTWNGANFYFRVFAKKLMAEQAAKPEAKPAAAAATSGADGKKDS